MQISRRVIVGGGAALAAAQAQKPMQQRPQSWRPKLGIYCRYSPGNMKFAGEEGFRCVQLSVDKTGLTPEMTDEQIEEVKRVTGAAELTIAALSLPGNHLEPEPAARAHFHDRFVKTLELAGKLGVGYVSSSTGAVPGQQMDKFIPDVVRVYEEKYFATCQSRKVRILWEPHVNPFNIATSPVGFSALFKAFHDSPHVGLQMDPSHLVWQMIDPIECTREFVGKIFNVHLKDTEILYPLLRRTGVQALDGTRWWRFRLPGSGSMDWKAFFTVLAEAGYSGGMNIENEDQLYYPNYDGTEFTGPFKSGFRVAHQYLRQFVPAIPQK